MYAVSQQNVFLLTLQLMLQTACAKTVYTRFWTIASFSPSSFCERSCALQRVQFPVADHPERRAIGPCLHIQHHCLIHCQESPCAGALCERIAVRCATAAERAALPNGWRSVRPRNSSDSGRTSTAERCRGCARHASPAPPASDVCVAGSALPRVARALCHAYRSNGSFGVSFCHA